MSAAKEKNTGGILAKILVPAVLIAAGAAGWFYFKHSAPEIKRKPPTPRVAAVEAITAMRGDVRARVSALGVAKPARTVILRSRVSGEVRRVSPRLVPGGRFQKGEEIASIDPADYRADLKKAQSALERARADLMIEQGSRRVAEEELKILSETGAAEIVETDLILREPQLKKARAVVASAEADLAKAGLNLKRTSIRAPFNALTLERHVEPGSVAGSQDPIATLAGADDYWVEVSVPLDRLHMLNIHPRKGSRALVRSQTGDGVWEGRAIRLAGRLEEKTRLATVIVRVADPLGPAAGKKKAGRPSRPLMINDYVEVAFSGKTIRSAIPLPRKALRDGDAVWLYDDGRLRIVKADLAWKQDGLVLVESGLEEGEKVIVSDISLPVEGMPLVLMEGKKTKEENAP
ncbi:RND family efflux transporter, MFP subunit [Candidatus Desulfarcum epimagneticum]|uniref:RND family efflux transporter, MFP subunit n=1 Tax=uncultured Desulfobacteraceae bacterium TaxID=218296 RepID=A0A484HKV6_9BACT|nr:RND family efflux transporter, MFP subunit [uncultured Desulfobacteraceae bacterium]